MTTEEQKKAEDSDSNKTPSTRARSPSKRSTRARSASKGTARPKAAAKDTKKTAGSRPTRRRRPAAPKEGEGETRGPEVTARPLPRMLERLRAEVGPALTQEFGYTSAMQIPRLHKIVLNVGLGEALENQRAIESATRDIAAISGQHPVITRARKSVAGFKIREGMAIGLSVTLRGRRMYEFLDRLISSTLPRIRDFQGVKREAFDGRGNYSLGIREHVVFPEIDYNTIDRIRGLQVAIVTTARTDREGLRLLELLGMPFSRSREPAMVA